MKKFFRTSKITDHTRSAAIFCGVVLAYIVLRNVPPIGKALRSIEHGALVVGTVVGNAIARVSTSEQSLTTKFALCTAEVQSLAAQNAVLRQNVRNIEELEALLNYRTTSPLATVAARIIGRALPEIGTVVIDKGTNEGMAIGAAVIIGDGQLYGVIDTVHTTTSTVRLTTHRESKIPATILGRERTIGLVEGQEGSVLHMAYIPEDTVIEVGNVVVTSGMDGVLSPNIVIGVVTSVEREDTAPFLDARVEPLFDAREWTNVLVFLRGVK